MNHYQFDCKLFISEDGKELMLYNNKMSTMPTYVYEQTPEDILKEAQMTKEAALTGEKLPEQERLHEFSYHLSSSSGKLDDIQGIIFGGFSSLFWMYRKHLILRDCHNK